MKKAHKIDFENDSKPIIKLIISEIFDEIIFFRKNIVVKIFTFNV